MFWFPTFVFMYISLISIFINNMLKIFVNKIFSFLHYYFSISLSYSLPLLLLSPLSLHFFLFFNFHLFNSLSSIIYSFFLLSFFLYHYNILFLPLLPSSSLFLLFTNFSFLFKLSNFSYIYFMIFIFFNTCYINSMLEMIHIYWKYLQRKTKQITT